MLPRLPESESRRRAAGLALARRRRARARAAPAPRAASTTTARGSSSMAPCASPARSSTVRSSASKAARPGSYGMETVTSARAESASRSAHSAPVRSSNPYANTGSPDQASRSPRSRSTACRRRPSRSCSPSLSSSFAIGRREHREIAVELARVDESRLELPDRLQQRVGESGGCRRRAQLAQLDALDRAAYGERALDLRRDRHSISARTRNVAKQVVERPHGASEQRGTPTNQVPLDPIDVDPVRYDEPRIMLEHREIALQKQRNLADVRRPGDERETHRFIVVLASGALSYAPEPVCAKSAETATGRVAGRPTKYATDFGLRPRRATCWPGIPAAQSSQRSACFDPRRASV